MVWDLYNERVVVGPLPRTDLNGAERTVDLESADRDARDKFDKTIGRPYSKGIDGPVSDTIHVRMTVGARQRIKAFGPRNKNLVGAMVEDRGSVRAVVVSHVVQFPLRADFQPVDESE